MRHTDYFLMRALTNWSNVDVTVARQTMQPGSIQSLGEVLAHVNDFDIFSFDVFDTLLRRDVEPPTLPLQRIAQVLAAACARVGRSVSTEVILEARQRAEAAARHAMLELGHDAECTVGEIVDALYTLLAREHGVDLEAVLPRSAAIDVEVATEASHLVAMPQAVETLRELRTRGKRVLLVSDMHLEHAHLRAFLERAGIFEHVHELVVSCVPRRSKGSGRLFHHLIETGTLVPGRTLHVGDNVVSDVQRAKESGLDARLFQPLSELERRAAIDAHRIAAERFGDIDTLGRAASIHARRPESTQASSAAFDLGKTYFGPAYALFAHDLFLRAQRDGYRDVFFLARDGFVFRELYESIRDRVRGFGALHPPRSHYVHLSRSITKFVACTNLPSDLITRIDPTNRRWGLNALLTSFGLDAANYAEFAATESSSLTTEELTPLGRDSAFVAKLRRDHEEQTALLRDYLIQQKILGPGHVLFADIGWAGTILDSLEHAFAGDADFPRIDVALFGVERTHARTKDKVRFLDGFAYDEARQNPIEALVNQGRDLLELVASPSVGPVVAYERTPDGTVLPRFDTREADTATAGIVAEIQRGILACGEELIDNLQRFALDPTPFRAAASIRLAEAITGRAPAIREVFADAEFNQGWGASNRVRVADFFGSATTGPNVAPPVASDALRVRIESGNVGSGAEPKRVIEKLIAAIERLRAEDELIVYGVGTVASLLGPALAERIAYFVDSNQGLEGRTFIGKPIFPVSKLNDAIGKTVFVTPIKRKSVLEPVLARFDVNAIYIDDLL